METGSAAMPEKRHTYTQERTKTILCIAIVAVYVLSLLPILVAGRWNCPASDDVSSLLAAESAWQASHSVTAMLRTAAKTAAGIYESWQGTYAAAFLQPLLAVFSPLENAWAVPAAMLLLLTVATGFLSCEALCGLLQADRRTWLTVTAAGLFCAVQFLQTPAEGFFWLSGAFLYTGFFAFAELMLALLLRARRAKPAGKAVCTALAAVLAATVAGGAYTLIPPTGALLLGNLVWNAAQKRRKDAIAACVVLLIFLAGAACNLLAPGNQARLMQEYASYGTAGMSPVRAVLTSLLYGFCTLLARLEGATLALCLLAAVLTAPKIARSACRFRYPLLVFLLSACVLSSMYTATMYSVGSAGPGRQWNLIYFASLWVFAANAVYLTGWLMRRFPDGTARAAEAFRRLARYPALLLAVLAVLIASTAFQRGFLRATSVAAVQEIVSGTAAGKYNDWTARYDGNIAGALDGKKNQPEHRETRLFIY